MLFSQLNIESYSHLVRKLFMETKIEKEVRYLKVYAVVITLVFVVLLFSAFTSANKNKFEEIEVERINVVEKDGKLKMVIANKARQHPGIIDGKYFKEREGQRAAGMIFFSEKGDEIGGLIFDGNTGEGQYGSLTFDKFRGDQTIQFLHGEDADGKYFAGLKMNGQNMPLMEYIAKQEEISKLPKEEQAAAWQKVPNNGRLMPNRVLIGRDYDKSSVIRLKDEKGRTRIEASVRADGNPKLNFLDENGKVVYSLPEDGKASKK